MLRKTRVSAIKRFLGASSLNSIPNNVLLAFPAGVATFTSLHADLSEAAPGVDVSNACGKRVEWGTISFDFDAECESSSRPIQVVDGQHRLFGMGSFDDERLPVLFVALVDTSVHEQAFQFIVINNKSTRVATDNIKSIIEGVNEDGLRKRLLEAGVPYGETSPILRDLDTLEASPFRHLLDWDFNKKGTKLIPLTALEQAVRYARSLFEFLRDDEDTLVQLLIAVWSSAKRSYPTLWGRANTFMTKVNINALNEFAFDKLKSAWEFDRVDIDDMAGVEAETDKLLGKIPMAYWDSEWQAKVQDNANVRSIIKRDLDQMVVNQKLQQPWRTGLEMVADSEDPGSGDGS